MADPFFPEPTCKLERTGDMTRPKLVLGPALIAGFGVYCPLPLVRGAIVGLLPGLVSRSGRNVWLGIVCGAALDLVVCMICMALGPTWEPRGGYNRTLATYLPPVRIVVTHSGGGQEAAFFPSLLFWWAFFILLWALLWSPRPSLARIVGIIAAGESVIFLAALFLWLVSPMDEWWHWGYRPHRIESPILYLMVFLPTMPACSIFIARLLALTPERTHDPTKCKICKYDLTGNVSGICPECGTTIDASARTSLTPKLSH